MHHFVIDSAALLPYINGEQDVTTLDPVLAAHVATLRDWQALYAVTRPPATTFAELDARSQAIYGAIAAALPGHAVYATGSRVKGSWRSGAPNDPKTAIAQRLGKPLESDVDVVVLDVDNATFRQAVAPIAAAYGVRIDRQPATTHPQILISSGQGDRRQGDKETRRQGDRRQGDKETRRQGDRRQETGRQGDKETRRQGDRVSEEVVSCLVSPVSYLLSRISCLVSRISCLLSRASYLVSRVSYLVSRVSCLVSRVSLPSDECGGNGCN